MIMRKVIVLDKERCDGCGFCIPNCAEGALKVVDGKLQIMEELCDGLGACVGACPKGALQVIERGTSDFDVETDASYIRELRKTNPEKATKHLEHLEKVSFSAPSAMKHSENQEEKSNLSQWPIKLELVPPKAPFLKQSNLLVVADCVPFAYKSFHQELLNGRKIVIGCPKFGPIKLYLQKLVEILGSADVKTLEVVRMEVPCCGALTQIAGKAVEISKKDTQVKETIIGIKGKKLVSTSA